MDAFLFDEVGTSKTVRVTPQLRLQITEALAQKVKSLGEAISKKASESADAMRKLHELLDES